MLASGDLSQFDVIVLGVRAYDRRPDLREHNQRLILYADNGGTVIVQYQRAEFNETQYGPYPAKTSDARITDENAPMEILTRDHPGVQHAEQDRRRDLARLGAGARHVFPRREGSALRRSAAFAGSVPVQCRIRRPASSWKRASAQGRWIYTGLGLWRQLPAGVDGAYRLLANLLSLGKR